MQNGKKRKCTHRDILKAVGSGTRGEGEIWLMITSRVRLRCVAMRATYLHTYLEGGQQRDPTYGSSSKIGTTS